MPAPKFTNDRLRQLLGLESDEEVARVQSALTEDAEGAPAAAAAAAGEGGAAAPAADASAAGTPAAPVAAPAPVAPAAPVAASTAFTLPEGTVLLSQGQLDELVAKADAGNGAAEQLSVQRRDSIISTALAAGKITVAEANGDAEKNIKGWRAQLDEDEARTVSLLGVLSAGRVPVTQQGHGQEGGGVASAQDTETAVAFDTFSHQVLGIPMPQRQATA